MRYISQALLNRLNEKWQVEAKDAQPKLRLVATQATVNTLISEPIHEDIPSAYGDVAIRQLPGEKTPSPAYAICIDDGIAKVYERNFPADLDNPWQYVWTLGEAKDVGVEFNGQWVLEAKSRWYILETEESPYIFWIGIDNSLYAQKWNDESTRLTLDTGVSQLTVCKGWKSSLMTGLDQGIIIGYLKSGRVYYRAYCQQDSGEYIWEPSYEITELGENINFLSVFRTNDFRIGFVAETGGQMKWVLSHRNYAGMSFRPETVNAQIMNVRCYFDKLVEYNFYERNTVTAELKYLYCSLMPIDAADTVTVTSVEKLNVPNTFESNGFKLYLSHKLFGEIGTDILPYMTISPTTTITSIIYDDIEQAITLLVSPNIRRNMAVTITLPEYRPVYYEKYQQQKEPLNALTANAPAEVNTIQASFNETVSASITNLVFLWKKPAFHYSFTRETVTAETTNVSVTLQAVSNLPI